MALNDISLTAGMRSNLLSLQSTTTLLDRTQTRLASGKKVNTALDNPTNFFAAQNHTQRAADLTTRKDGMTEAVQGVQAANKGITNITALIEAAKGLTQAARSADATNRNSLAGQFNTVLTQISQMASDSGYKGKDFLTNDSLQVLFNETGGSKLTISGFDATATGMGVLAVTVGSSSAATGTTSATGYQTVNIVTHTATLATELPAGTIAASTFTQAASGAFRANATGLTDLLAGGTSGLLSFDITNIAGLMGGNTFTTGTMYSGALTVNAVIIEGIRFTSSGTVEGATGTTYSGLFTTGDATAIVNNFNSQLSGKDPLSSGVVAGVAAAFNITGAVKFTGSVLNNVTGVTTTTGFVFSSTTSIRVEFTAGALTASGGIPSASNLIYDLAAGDIASGVNILTGFVTGTNGADGKTKLTGLVMVDSVWVDPANYTVSGTKVYFKTGAAPTLGKVTYAYNSGFTAGDATYKSADSMTVVTGQALTTGQSITAVYSNGTALDSTAYKVSGAYITLNTGLGTGSTITYQVTTTVSGGWASDSGIDDTVNQLNTAIDTLRTQSANMASNLNVVTIRQEFTDGMVATLLKGADNLTLADMNEEGANMLMLQTRQQLGTTSLKMASDAAQSVLRLF